MCSCHSILECCVMFSGVKLSMGSFVLLLLLLLQVQVDMLECPTDYFHIQHNRKLTNFLAR